ncbi:MAG: helix-turn-helix domain-containing protein, partial [Lentisphaeria bacterium]|nr:helix-turn-helix domain-containing protein [Lentisphaeria bacterium]
MDIKFYSLEEVADLFGVNYQLVYKLVKTGELPSVRIGKIYRISEPQLKEYMDRQSQGTPASGVVEHTCSRCGKKYYSAFSISGTCKQCGA